MQIPKPKETRMKKNIPHRTVKRRSSDRNSGLRFKLRVIIDTIFGKKSDNRRRAGKKGNRRRKVVAYAATGFVVFAVLITVVLAGGGKAEPEQPSETALAQVEIMADVSAN